VTIDVGEGFADGVTVDDEGFVWIAVYGGGAVRRYAPSGELALVVELPVTQPTSCTFGGADLRDLYITSARQHLEPAELAAEPLAGGVFRCRPGPAGLPATAFAG
jgi:xylono-1,5-lactonase